MEIMKKIISWIATDGLLHILACAVVMLSVLVVTDIMWLAVAATSVLALAKEVWDVCIQKDNNLIQAGHDIICDLAGMIYAITLYII